MADYFVCSEFASGELAAVEDATQLLGWARGIAAAADSSDVYRHKEGRRTLRFETGGRSFFLKLHGGVGWAEIVKNLVQGRLPVVSAVNEYRAIKKLQQVGVDTLTVSAYAVQGRNPATRESMLVSEDLVGTVSLEHYCAKWAATPPAPDVRMRLIRKLAEAARSMHEAGINHRDFYLCHFHLDERSLREDALRCYLIDLHRAQLRGRTPRRWQVKDLGSLYFSAMDCGLTQRDLQRFMRHYCKGGLREALDEQAGLWRQVEQRAQQLYAKGQRNSRPADPHEDRRTHG